MRTLVCVSSLMISSLASFWVCSSASLSFSSCFFFARSISREWIELERVCKVVDDVCCSARIFSMEALTARLHVW